MSTVVFIQVMENFFIVHYRYITRPRLKVSKFLFGSWKTMENEMSENKKELVYLSYEQEENGNLTY